jgi:hypothetical protein
MTNFRHLGVAAILVAALAGPAAAQTVISSNPYAGTSQYGQDVAYRGDRRGWNDGWHDSWNDQRWNRDSGFWPADVAAGVVGGAIGTAGAIATAPFQRDSYAYDNDGYSGGYDNDGYRGGYDRSWAARNGFVCQPGTWFKGEDGLRHICQ